MLQYLFIVLYELFQDPIFSTIIKMFCYYLCFAYNLGEVYCWTKPKERPHFLISITVEVVYSQHNAQSQPYFASFFQNESILPNKRIFWFSVKNISCMLTVSQTTKTPIYSGVPLNHRAVCSLSIFLLTVSIVLIMHGACVHRASLWILLRWIFLGLVVEVQSVCLDHSFISLPIPCSHLYVTSDEQHCCSLLETLHGSLAL